MTLVTGQGQGNNLRIGVLKRDGDHICANLTWDSFDYTGIVELGLVLIPLNLTDFEIEIVRLF